MRKTFACLKSLEETFRNASSAANPGSAQQQAGSIREVLENTNAYLAAYVLIIMFSLLVISLDGFCCWN